VVAVNQLDLDLYSGQIFCLLGHNGAGARTREIQTVRFHR
jgi:ABC-type multidrug transport system ATPase subunit